MGVVLYRYQGEQQFRPVNGGAMLDVSGGSLPPGGEGYDADLGVIGNRPALTQRPDATNTGPRDSMVQTMSGSQAMAAIMAAPVEADGYRYLRRTHITSSINLNSTEHHSLRFEDCLIAGGGTYIVRGFYNVGGVLPAGPWPEFRFCEIRGGSSASTIGSRVRYLRCNIHRGVDIAKPGGDGGEYYACWMHDTWHPSGAHCDIVQIVSRASNLLLHWNNMVGRNAPDSPSSPGGYSSGVLQTGTVTNNIGPVQWNNNWFDGGGYTIRGVSSSDLGDYTVEYTFRNNRFGRDYRYGPLLRMNIADFDESNVWDDDGTPVQA